MKYTVAWKAIGPSGKFRPKRADELQKYETAMAALKAVDGLLASDEVVSYVLDPHGLEISIDGLRLLARDESETRD